MCQQETLRLLRDIQGRRQVLGTYAVRVVVVPGNQQALWREIIEEAFDQDVRNLHLLPGPFHLLVPQTVPTHAEAREEVPFVFRFPSRALDALLQADAPPTQEQAPLLVVIEHDVSPEAALVNPQERVGAHISYYESQQPTAPQERLSLPEATIFLRNLVGTLAPTWLDNFATRAARIDKEREGVGRRVYNFSLQQLSDKEYRRLVIEEAWAKDFPACLRLLKEHRALCLTGSGAGVDFFARLLLRCLAEEKSTLRRGLQFADCRSFQQYRAQNVVGAGFILRHYLDYFLVRRPPKETERFHILLRGEALGECLRRLEENDSYLIVTSSHALCLKEFEQAASRASTEASFSEWRKLWRDALPRVPLERVFRRLPNRGAGIARALNRHWNWQCQSHRTHVGERVRPRFRR